MKIRCHLSVLYIFLLCLCAAQAKEPRSNPAFGGRDNQISAHFGVSARGQIEELYLGGAQYSQPNRFFRIPGRQSIELMTAHGSGELSRYNQALIFGFAQDAVFPLFGPVYAGINLGIYIKSATTDRISSRFTFGERVFLGADIYEDYRLELYGRHFSNGTLTEKNGGQNFLGLSVMRNF